MAAAAAGHYSDDLHQSIIQRLAELTTEDIRWLLCNPWTLDTVVERLGLESDEAGMLHYILGQELMRREEGDPPWGCLPREERMFLWAFPWRKHRLEKTIRELRAIADEADSAHKTLTQTNLVASSAGAVSAAMTILGVALSPVTAGGSLLLSVAGQGLGAAAFVTNVVTNVLEDRSKSSARAQASRLVAFPQPPEPEAGGGVSLSPVETTWEAAQRCCEILGSVRKLRAYWEARANPGFMARVRNFVTTRRVPFWRATGVQRAVGGGSALAMTRGARVLRAAGVAGAGISLVQDVKSVLRDWQHLREGARTEVAMDLRTQAEELEQELSHLSRRYQQIILRQNRSLEAGGRNRAGRWEGEQGCWGCGDGAAGGGLLNRQAHRYVITSALSQGGPSHTPHFS
ncbi:apolipoprotein L5 [Phyllostomus hastatus]|uniref:apolipoprotein L5 n=1 Tax=Phyllostomus hastatus TaxID=9423 RepID=UPI001E67EB3D|nr:apolipoprotein L5 [Phyllostomus hastatus]XP_045682565.1 apolipoprotein L5 [Phyllostomus hastatus]XP_045682566.1 apolipoprotein L5 [Phyllostomus hastatus]